jgi:integrase
MSSLVEHILTQHQETTLYGQSDHFVFCRSNVDKDNPQDHRPLDPDHIRRYVLYPAMKAAKIPIESRGNGLHLFRHTVVSELAKRNGLKAAQDQAGHSDISTTADVYTHIDAEQKLASAKSIQEAFAVALAEPFAKALAEPTAALLLPSVPSSVVN